MNKTEIAKELNISRQHLYELINGEQSCSEEMLEKLNKYFNLDYTEVKRDVRFKILSYWKENKQ